MSQLSAPEAGDDAQPAPLTFASLPRALQCEVFARTPVDARARAACVCHAWCDVLSSESSLWLRLNLSPGSGVARERVTDALLRGAAAKACGRLTALDVSGCPQLTHEALLEVLAANAGALTELHRCIGSWLPYVTAEQIDVLLRAAPSLRVCHADTQAAATVACRMLRNEPPFGPLRVHKLIAQQPWPGGEADVHAFAADFKASASSLSWLLLLDAPLDGLGALNAVVDAALARRLPALALFQPSLSAASAPALARLLSGSALRTLLLVDIHDVTLLQSGPEGSAAVLAAALRANNTLAMLGFSSAHIWLDVVAAETLLQALTAHPSLQTLRFDHNVVPAADRARAGASLGALIEANAPVLEVLYVPACSLGDEGLGPLADALAANTHLQLLDFSRNDMSEVFALERLQPALLANNSLRNLTLLGEDDEADAASPALCQLEQLVAQRAAARDAVASMTAATAAVAVQ
jgi:hypothetical protein